MDCLSSEDLKGRRRNSLCLTAYAESWCCQVGNVLGRATTFGWFVNWLAATGAVRSSPASSQTAIGKTVVS